MGVWQENRIRANYWILVAIEKKPLLNREPLSWGIMIILSLWKTLSFTQFMKSNKP